MYSMVLINLKIQMPWFFPTGKLKMSKIDSRMCKKNGTINYLFS